VEINKIFTRGKAETNLGSQSAQNTPAQGTNTSQQQNAPINGNKQK
jgi:hypothetical protein